MEEDMERLLDIAEGFCRQQYRTQKELAPLIHIVTGSATPIIMDFGWANPLQKSIKLAMVRDMLRRPDATAYLLINEAWALDIEQKPGEKSSEPLPGQPGYVRPSQHPKRIEILALTAVTRDGDRECRMFKLKRDMAGNMREMTRWERPKGENPDLGGLLTELFEPDTKGNA